MQFPRLFILALDGTPFTLLQKLTADGIMPNFKKLKSESDFRQMDSVNPPVSSSAWASFLTGATPDQHGILGFVERNPADMDWFVPNTKHLLKSTLWQALSEQGKRVFSMNVPLTYPPQSINGISICGFLGTDITKGTYPPEIGTMLKGRGYRIDVDTELAKRDSSGFLDQLFEVFEKRMEIMWHFYGQEKWDVFMAHIMETDRLHHFFWEYYELKQEPYYTRFIELYRRIDRKIGKILNEMEHDSALMILSDHGFCTLKYSVYLNRWLVQNGYLHFSKDKPETLKDISNNTKAYSLYPGRIYINLKGREMHGSIGPGLEYEQLRTELTQRMQQFTDPVGLPVIKEVVRREEVYPESNQSSSDLLPDLIAIGHEGYDLKGNLLHPLMFDKTIFNGMHTMDDAFILGKGIGLPSGRFSIAQLYPAILKHISI